MHHINPVDAIYVLLDLRESVAGLVGSWPIATKFACFAKVSFGRNSRRDLLTMSITAGDPRATSV